MVYRSILAISDQHFPYNHPDIIPFLKALAKEFCPDLVINLGDEVDYHSMSFHEHSPDLLSPGDELQTAIERMMPLYDLFPKMTLMESNHGSLVYRRGRAFGLPRAVFKGYREILEAPKGWEWVEDLVVNLPNDQRLYVCHGKSQDVLKHSQSIGMNVLTGHFHEKFEIRYWQSPVGLFWGMIAGCLIEDQTLAFAYNKLNLKRPVIGTAVILDGIPRLCPMKTKNGRWTGEIV